LEKCAYKSFVQVDELAARHHERNPINLVGRSRPPWP
jgi:hypothetical protein